MTDLEDIGGRQYNYVQIGATRGHTPDGFHALLLRETVGTGRQQFQVAAEALMSLDVHKTAGLRVFSSQREVVPGADVLLEFGIWPLKVTAPCRVVYVVESESRIGFAYGSLDGHPESGEEAFIVELDPLGNVEFTITGFSRPARWYSRLAPAATRFVQHRLLAAYVDAMRRVCGGAA